MKDCMCRFSEELNWWGNDQEQNFRKVKRHYRGRTHLYFLEIGILEGRSACWVLDHILKDDYSHLDCIDVNITDNGRYNLSLFDGKVTLYEGLSIDILSKLMGDHQNCYDFIYVDGGHFAKVLISDLILSWKLLKRDGLLLIDDYELHKYSDVHLDCPSYIPPKPAIDSFIYLFNDELQQIFSNYQICLKKVV